MIENKTFIGFPFYGQAHPSAVVAATVMASDEEDTSIRFGMRGGSFLVSNFNQLWSDALQMYERGEITHFAMLHSDIAPEPNWVDKLLAEMKRLNASVVSAVAPIKDNRGLSSCGIDIDDSCFHVRRITMHEIMDLPETFGTEDLDAHGIPTRGRGLLINTGCWLADLRLPLWHETDSDGVYKIYFNTRARLKKYNGVPTTEVESEDWMFSRALHRYGVKYYATRKVKLVHHGEWAYGNQSAWGTVLDEADKVGLET